MQIVVAKKRQQVHRDGQLDGTELPQKSTKTTATRARAKTSLYQDQKRSSDTIINQLIVINKRATMAQRSLVIVIICHLSTLCLFPPTQAASSARPALDNRHQVAGANRELILKTDPPSNQPSVVANDGAQSGSVLSGTSRPYLSSTSMPIISGTDNTTQRPADLTNTASTTTKIDISATTDSLTSTGASRAEGESFENDESNTTMLIEYDQQNYNLTIKQITGQNLAKDSEVIDVRNHSLIEDEKSSQSKVSALKWEDRISTLEPILATSTSASELPIGELTTSVTLDQEPPRAAKLVSSIENGDDDHNRRPSLTSRSGLRARDRGAGGVRDLRDTKLEEASGTTNVSSIYQELFKKKPFSKYWTVEQKWDDIFKRLLALKDTIKLTAAKNMLKDAEYLADVSISSACVEDLRYVQEYQKKSSNFRWLMHMADATGKSEPGMLTGNMAELGHVIQCIRVRAPARPTNDTFDERFFDLQTQILGERFRGKYCLASVRPVMPTRPKLVSRFNSIMDESLLSNISYMGESAHSLKLRQKQLSVPKSIGQSIDREHNRMDQVPFESELYQYLISSRQFMYSLPRFMGVCYPSSCSQQDIQLSIQKTLDDQHLVVDIEYDCEQEEVSSWEWYSMPRLVVFVFLTLVAFVSVGASVARYIIVDKMGLKRNTLRSGGLMSSILVILDIVSFDKSVGILFVKTLRASPIVNRTKLENNRSNSIDALKGFLILVLIYSQLVYLGCLPLPFMWSRWTDSMFPFYRSAITQLFLNAPIWSDAFYMISAYLIGAKLLENHRHGCSHNQAKQQPSFGNYLMKRYMRLMTPMIAFITMNYVWPRLSNGFVLQDQSNKMLQACDSSGWTNMLMFHNHRPINETCLWPSHVGATFFQLHLISYPILLLLLYAIRTSTYSYGTRKFINLMLTYSGVCLIVLLSLAGLLYPAYLASSQQIIVPFLIDYLDFDNYRRVIELTITPTYNHITSYMFGLALAFIVIKKRANQDMNHSSGSQEAYLNKDSSSESVVSSSTQGLNSGHGFQFQIDLLKTKSSPLSGKRAIVTSESDGEDVSSIQGVDCFSYIWQSVKSFLSNGFLILLGLFSLTASWYWNGLGQPMSHEQTFWYLVLCKFAFNLSFACLFYRHFATRKNSTNPWMITRFLVPIGRMSLTLFYVSWLVIWFDLLSSLYQWHPSHYFVAEKFNEIISMALIISLFAYGIFEGSYKIVQYKFRADRIRRLAGKVGAWRVDSFEGFFAPDDDESSTTNCPLAATNPTRAIAIDDGKRQPQVAEILASGKGSSLAQHQMDASHLAYSAPRQTLQANADRSHLSITDRYKLSAELRANYSFASIGLYEKAGATPGLAPPTSSDPPKSPSTSPPR